MHAIISSDGATSSSSRKEFDLATDTSYYFFDGEGFWIAFEAFQHFSHECLNTNAYFDEENELFIIERK